MRRCSSTPTICSTGGVNGATVTALTAGTCTITANQAGNDDYHAAPGISADLVISKLAQTISAITFNPKTLPLGGATTASATADSGLKVTLTSTTPSVCTVTDNLVTSIGAGTCTIAADQAGNVDYLAAPRVTTNLIIPKADQTIGAISFTPGQISLGETATASAVATSGLTISWSTTTTSICTINGRNIQGIGVGTCTVTASQAGDANYKAASPQTGNLVVGKGSQTISAITFTPTSLEVDGSTKASATASSGLPVVFTSTTPSICSAVGINGSTIQALTSGNCTIAANQAGNSTYGAAPQVTGSLSVGDVVITKSNQTIGALAFNPTTLEVGGTTTVSATASSGLAVTFTSQTTDICTVNGEVVSGKAAGTCTIAANQAGNASYNAAPQVTQNIAVTLLNPNRQISQRLELFCRSGAALPQTISIIVVEASENATAVGIELKYQNELGINKYLTKTFGTYAFSSNPITLNANYDEDNQLWGINFGYDLTLSPQPQLQLHPHGNRN